MKFEPKIPPRAFEAGEPRVTIRDCGAVALEADEQVTFVTEAGGEYDVCRKSWGFYATPSLNVRLPSFGLRPALAEGRGRYFVLLVESGQEAEFERYLDEQKLRVVCWLDREENFASSATMR